MLLQLSKFELVTKYFYSGFGLFDLYFQPGEQKYLNLVQTSCKWTNTPPTNNLFL